jgi:hypothetical protein
MKELNEFVARENQWSSLFKGHTLVEIKTAAGRQRVADRIDCQLSPENLSCDGELSYAESNRRYRYLNKCAAQLLALDPSVKFYEYA